MAPVVAFSTAVSRFGGFPFTGTSGVAVAHLAGLSGQEGLAKKLLATTILY